MKTKIKKYWWTVVIILIVIGGTFYWFQWRPAEIRKNCYRINLGTEERFEMNYKNCLLNNGLEK